MSRFLKHTLRCVVFLAVLALLLTGVSQLVRPKNNTRSDGIHDPAANGILGEPDNTIDLLILGDSESYSAFIPMQLWQQYGYTAYCCGTSRQTLYYSEAFLHKAFQKQSPKLVILETDVIYIDFSYGSMLLQEAGDLFPVFSYHDRWKSLKANDWRMTVNYTHTENAKGYQLRCNAAPAGASNYMTPSRSETAPMLSASRPSVTKTARSCCSSVRPAHSTGTWRVTTARRHLPMRWVSASSISTPHTSRLRSTGTRTPATRVTT